MNRLEVDGGCEGRAVRAPGQTGDRAVPSLKRAIESPIACSPNTDCLGRRSGCQQAPVGRERDAVDRSRGRRGYAADRRPGSWHGRAGEERLDPAQEVVDRLGNLALDPDLAPGNLELERHLAPAAGEPAMQRLDSSTSTVELNTRVSIGSSSGPISPGWTGRLSRWARRPWIRARRSQSSSATTSSSGCRI